ncbi:NADAR family protein [Myxococcus sp. K38C18041901]|uniref:NADAR family protein n=1 Tax=Myxococcus guangdongensis TaxID=2906760 RepID=UPI0020A74EE5|nr:NADAR family protein [Myxococcus guangdongensis]MCP3057767.1 NADAR family protein [Myxococcus guangdongensis]
MAGTRRQDRFTFFWTQESPFSQWHPCEFVVDGVRYNCMEQYMMAGKARLFADEEMLARIMASASPKSQKALGRKVSGFVDETWVKERERIIYEGNRAKFTQNASLLEVLLASQGTELVEASPMDRIWGVGLGMDDARILDPSKWRGLNLLGKVLTRLRDDLIAQGVVAR